MPDTVIATHHLALSASDMRTIPMRVALIVVGTLVLALSSYVSIPMIPVPVTMQTLAVTLIGAAYGWRLGTLTVAAWLAEAAIELPVLQGGASGMIVFIGPTGGYLASFPIVAAIIGVLVGRGWNGRHPRLAFAAMLIANLLCLLIGAAWLATAIGLTQAVTVGIVPFLVGGMLKSLLGAALLKAFARAA